MHSVVKGVVLVATAAIAAGVISMTNDAYRWLEDPDAKETRAWVDKENVLTRSYIDSYPARAAIEDRLKSLFNYERYSLPQREGDRYFYSKNDGLQNQAPIYMQKVGGGDPVVVLDPNTLSTDGTVAITGESYTEDGTLLGYGLSAAGSDWQELHVRDIDAGKDYDEVLKWCKFASVAWKLDKSGFWYNRFPAEGEPGSEQQGTHSRVCWHRLGTPQSEDVVVHQDDQNPELGFQPFTSRDGMYVFLVVYHGTDPKNGIYFRRQDSTEPFIHLVEHTVASFNPIETIGSTMYVRTDLDAPRGRVISIDLASPQRSSWKEVVPMAADQLQGASLIHHQFVLTYLHDASSLVRFIHLDGTPDHDFELPGIGSAGGFGGKITDHDCYWSFSSFVVPPTLWHYDFETGKSEVWYQPKINFDFSRYVTELVFATSKDGTKVPIHVTHRKGIQLDGSNPCLLYGYGGFNIPMTPRFSTARLVWMEMGGIFAQAVLRGGSEYGEQWHEAGMLGKKQNVFDDFIASAEHLIDAGYTRRDKLAIEGGSNGGLLVGACLTQRPDLYGAAVPQVGVLDMLRYHEFTIGWAWASEYGRSDKADQFPFLYKYSPLHNIHPGTKYPPTLILTGDHDDRVLPAHSFKFAATLQKAQAGDAPILIRIETRAGHGAGKSTQLMIEETADIYAFLVRALGMKVSGSA
jgi:prolyl oligopeptidase